MSTSNSVNDTTDDAEQQLRPPATPAELAKIVETYSRAVMLGAGGIGL